MKPAVSSARPKHKAHMLALVMLLRSLKGKLLGDLKARQAKRKAPMPEKPTEKKERAVESEEPAAEE